MFVRGEGGSVSDNEILATAAEAVRKQALGNDELTNTLATWFEKEAEHGCPGSENRELVLSVARWFVEE